MILHLNGKKVCKIRRLDKAFHKKYPLTFLHKHLTIIKHEFKLWQNGETSKLTYRDSPLNESQTKLLAELKSKLAESK